MYIINKLRALLALLSFSLMPQKPLVVVPSQLQVNCEKLLDSYNKQFPAPTPTHNKFIPFAQRLIFPTQSTLIFWGDLHGDIYALYATLNKLIAEKLMTPDLKIIDPHTYCIFLGDYVDRGTEGVEVIATLLTLKLQNPTQVFMVRGNHEDLRLNNRYGFIQELNKKFPHNALKRLVSKINTLYDTLPVVLYIGIPDKNNHINYIQCCHGGMEIGFDTRMLLDMPTEQTSLSLAITELNRASRYTLLKKTIFEDVSLMVRLHDISHQSLEPHDVGFMWSDFQAWQGKPGESTDATIQSTRGSGIISYGKKLTNALLKDASTHHYTLRGIIRGHQHNHTMPGIWENSYNNGLYALWNNTVFTLVTSPGPKHTIATTCMCLKTTDMYESWTLHQWYMLNNNWYDKKAFFNHWYNNDPRYH